MNWIIAAIAIAGTILNIKKQRSGFVLWTVSNSHWLIHNIKIGEYAQAVIFAVFLALSIYGFFAWGKKK